MFLTIMCEEAFRDLQNKCLPADPNEKSIEQIVEIFKELYCPKLFQTTAQLKFEERVQKEN